MSYNGEIFVRLGSENYEGGAVILVERERMREDERINGTFSADDFLEPNWQNHGADWELDGYLDDAFSPQDRPPSLSSPKVHQIRVKSLDEVEGCGSSSSSSFVMEDYIEVAAVATVGLAPPLTKHPSFEEKSSVEIPSQVETVKRTVGQATSASSRDDSEDDDAYAATGELTDPADAKRARRMQSNRESARRSRKRKQEQLNDLESQVGQLRDERNSLLNRFTDINRKCDDATVGNRILKADIETLRAKVKMAEEQVKRATEQNPRTVARGYVGTRFVGGHSNYVVSVSPNPSHLFQQPVPKFNGHDDVGGHM